MFNSDLLKNGLLGELGGMFKGAPASVAAGRGLLPVLGGVVGALAAIAVPAVVSEDEEPHQPSVPFWDQGGTNDGHWRQWDHLD